MSNNLIDPDTVFKFLTLLHERATAALTGLHEPGVLQLCRLQPDEKKLATTRYLIGDVERMTSDAVLYSEQGYNVFCEGRTVSADAPRRGTRSHTVGVFALVADVDKDTGKGGELLNGYSALNIESSVGTGNQHQRVFFEKAVTVETATALGNRMRAVIGADTGSFDPVHCYRVAGTTNYPNQKKLARGRTIAATKIADAPGTTISYEALAAAYLGEASPLPKPPAPSKPRPRKGRMAVARVRAKARRRTDDRSRQFQAVVRAAVEAGMTPDELEAELRAEPGCGSKYLKPVDRLRAEIDRSWHKVEQQEAEAEPELEQPVPPPPCTLADVHAAFRKWLGEEYDLDTIDAVVAAAASERLTGDPLWLLVVSGPGNAKTETVQALAGCGGHVTSTIASEGALLSATPGRERSKGATGGLLCKIGKRGILVIKDVTSILSADRNMRGTVLAALREIYDGRWERNVGTGGGRTLTWQGRLVVVGAVTTAWDTAHGVISVMGDRFVLLRSNSETGRREAGKRAINNTGDEDTMRRELAEAVGGLVSHVPPGAGIKLDDTEIDRVLAAADIVTFARTGVERDYRGDVINSHAPEMPTRLAKQLTQLIRGAVAVGMTREAAMQLAIRCARDSIPSLRLEILLDLAAHPGSRPSDVRRRLSRPWRTVARELEALHMLTLLQCDEEEGTSEGKTIWRYRLAPSFDRATLLAMASQKHRQKCDQVYRVRRKPIGNQ